MGSICELFEWPAEKRLGPLSGDNSVNRGGSWNNNARNCRSANRNRNTPDNRNKNVGLRLASTTQRVGRCCPIRTDPYPACGGIEHDRAGQGW